MTPISGHEEESRKVIAAVQAALHEGGGGTCHYHNPKTGQLQQ
ncbi:hypothetical protein [Anaerotignum sp.]